MSPPRYVLIANPATKRCETYRGELTAYWAARGLAAELEVVPWAEVVPRDGSLDALPAVDKPAVVRMESPGKDDQVTRLLLEAGARDDSSEPFRNWRSLDLPKGLLVRPGLLYRGFRRVLRGLRKSFDAHPHLRPTACPLAVAEMFDKTATAEKLAANDVPVPDMLVHPVDMPAVVHDLTLSHNTNTGLPSGAAFSFSAADSKASFFAATHFRYPSGSTHALTPSFATLASLASRP